MIRNNYTNGLKFAKMNVPHFYVAFVNLIKKRCEILMNYIAVTYDVCTHEHLYEDINEYVIDSDRNMDEQVKEFAEMDIAPLVKVYILDRDNIEKFEASDFAELALYKVYKFQQYQCNCTE